ncbi:MAG: DNA polymerase III subunit alpha [Acidobacteria bacterium]|nr:DNA polymerase III subunit alpha [Acidobacteriota bacterium]
MFVHLHVHSHFSLCRGVDSIEDLCAATARARMPMLALTDTNGVYGLVRFLETAKEHGLQPLIGAELRTPQVRAVLLCRSRRGYERLCRIISARHLEEETFSLEQSLLEDRSDLVVLSADVKLIAALARRSGTDRLYVEIHPRVASRRPIEFARRHGLPVVATGDVYFVSQAGWKTHQVLRAIDLNTCFSRLPAAADRSNADVARPDQHFHSRAEILDAFPHYPEAVENAGRIAEDCAFDLEFNQMIFPRFPLPPGEDDAFTYLRGECYSGAATRYGTLSDPVLERLERELNIIRIKGFAEYFLVVQDIVRRMDRTCGRGSAAASLVAYCLGITHVDPIRHNLFFERFLNEGRKDPPDIDVDFGWDERDDVLDEVFKKYGEERTAMISNHVTFRAKAAVREVAKVYGLPEGEIKTITDRMRWFWDAPQLSETLTRSPAFRHVDFRAPWPEILQLAERLEGVPRNLSVHCGGVVIVPDAVTRYVPVQRAAKGVRIIQWEKDQAEDAGLIKIDLLGNRSLSVIRDALQGIREHHGVAMDYARWNPLDDPKTQSLLRDGDTMGVFYVESPAMRQLQQKTRRGDFDHLVIHSSIIRPAANTYIREYVHRLRGGAYRSCHPLMDEIMHETYGLMVYQEDVSKMAMAMAGFSAYEADDLRKVLSKKNKQRRLQDYREQFYRGALRRGVTPEVVDEIWAMIMSFAGYSFCKPHSASYALVSFKSAYLRAHYPAEFMAAVISNQGGYYSTFAYVSEARRMGIRILPPDINRSERHYTGCSNELRVGLMQLRDLKSAALDRILEERRRDGPFVSLEAFLTRVRIDPSDVRVLIKAGAMDAIACGATRPELMWAAAISAARRNRADDLSGTLFPPSGATAISASDEYDEATMLKHERETLGFLVSRHPLTLYRSQIKHSYVLGRDLHRYVGKEVTALGWLVTGKVVTTKDDEFMEFISFEDTTALYEATFFPGVYARFCHMLSHDHPYLLRGKVEEDYSAITLTVSDVRRLAYDED